MEKLTTIEKIIQGNWWTNIRKLLESEDEAERVDERLKLNSVFDAFNSNQTDHTLCML